MWTSFPTGVGFGRVLDHAARAIESGTAASGSAVELSALIGSLAKFLAGDPVRLSMTAIILAVFLFVLIRPTLR